MQAVEKACKEIVKVLQAVDGLKNVPINPPDTMSYDTFAVVYPDNGSILIAPVGTREGLHNIAIDALTTRTDLARDIAKVKPFIDTIADAILTQVSYDSDDNPGGMFNDSISTFGKLSYSWIATDYGGVPIIGYHFVMEGTKIQVNL